MSLGNQIGTSGPGSVIITWTQTDFNANAYFRVEIYTSNYTRILVNRSNGIIEQLVELSPNRYVINFESPDVPAQIKPILTFEDPSAVVLLSISEGSGKFLRIEGLELLSNCGDFSVSSFNRANFAFPPKSTGIYLLNGNDSQPYLWNLPPALENLELFFQQSNIQNFNPTIPLPSGLIDLGLSDNQLTVFDPVTPLPDSLIILDLGSNQLTNFNPSLHLLPEGLEQLDLRNNQLTSLIPMNFLPDVDTLHLDFNQLNASAVDDVLVYLDSTKSYGGGGFIDLRMSPPAPPSGAGLAAKSSLQSKGYTVVTDIAVN